MKHVDLKGTGVAIVTPFNKDLTVDYISLEKIICHILSGGVDFIVVLGTTGEASLLSLEERNKILSFIYREVKGKVPLVLGYGGISTAEMAEGLRHIDYSCVDALLIVTPYYVKPSQEGLLLHYTTLADAAGKPIILYNVPGRTGVNMEPDTTLKLASHPNIIGIKEASGKLFQIEELLLRKPSDFLLFSGDDALTFHLMNAGADGVISVMANAFPKEIQSIVTPRNPEFTGNAAELHMSLKMLTKAVFSDGNPSGIIYLLSLMGLCNNIVRLPLAQVNSQTAAFIKKEFEAWSNNFNR